MYKTVFPLERFQQAKTPFYYYDLNLLRETLRSAKESASDDFVLHYAIKANANPVLLEVIRQAGFGIDAVSANEIALAISYGFKAEDMVFAGVGKTDDEIDYALTVGVGCLNVESREELEVIEERAQRLGIKAPIALRVNPEIEAHTHEYITTGLADNKFGIPMRMLEELVDKCIASDNLDLKGLHFHIGSQVTKFDAYVLLCELVNKYLDDFQAKGISFENINLGGGLGIDYDYPDANPLPVFGEFFDVIRKNLKHRPGQNIHFEFGRSIVGQCGSLISRVVFVKSGVDKKFVILDGGFTELIRPALYQAVHLIQNLTNPNGELREYDVVGPICESTDTFLERAKLPLTKRGDIYAIRSAGAYGEAMSSNYNCRKLNPAMYSE